MITELIIKLFFRLFEGLLTLLPEIQGRIPDGFISLFGNFIKSVAYFLPLGVLLPMIVLSFSVDIFGVIWKIILRIKSFIPGMGN